MLRPGRLAVSAALLLFSATVLLSAVPAARAQEETGELPPSNFPSDRTPRMHACPVGAS
jgi:hypothetical protein